MQPRKFDWSRYYTRAAAGTDLSPYFSRVWTSIAVIAEIINGLELMSEAAAKINSSLSHDDGATLFDYGDLLVAKACAVWENTNLAASKLIDILDHPNISSARIKAIFEVGCLTLPERIAAVLEGDQFAAADAATSVNGSFYTLAELTSAFDHANLTDAKAASIFDHVNLLVSKAVSMFNHANLTTAKLIAILDHANITSARIKAIFETGSLSVVAKRAATLEGDQYATADAATSVNGTSYTVADLASAFEHTILTVVKAASILDHANLVASKGASIFNHANLTSPRGASICADINLTVAKIASILNHANLATAKAAFITDDVSFLSSKLKDVFLHANLLEAKRVSIAHGWGRLGGVTPNTSGTWTSAPGSLTNATDNNPATTITAGNVYAAATQEKWAYLNFDIGSLQAVKVITVKYAAHKVGSGSHTYHIYLQHSANGTDWTDIVSSITGVDTSYEINATLRYIRFELYAKGGAISGEVTVYLDSCHFCLC